MPTSFKFIQPYIKVRPKLKVPRHVLELNGVDGYVVPSQNRTDSQGTIEAWIKTNNVTTTQRIYMQSTGGASTDRFGAAILSSAFRLDGGYTGGVQLSMGTPQNNIWYHIVWTSDGFIIKGYINGAEQALTVVSGTNTGQWFNAITNNYARIGDLRYDDATGETQYFNGIIHAVRIYNRALSAAEISNLFVGQDIQDSALVLHHKYSLGHARDLSGNGNNGTLNGGTKFNIVNYEEV